VSVGVKVLPYGGLGGQSAEPQSTVDRYGTAALLWPVLGILLTLLRCGRAPEWLLTHIPKVGCFSSAHRHLEHSVVSFFPGKGLPLFQYVLTLATDVILIVVIYGLDNALGT
jgi:hypothetical protein